MFVKKVSACANHSTQIAGIHLPKGAVYAICREPKLYIWVTDIAALNDPGRRYVDAYTLGVNDKAPRRRVISVCEGVGLRLKDYAMTHVTPVVKASITRRALSGMVPHDRMVKYRPMDGGHDSGVHTTTDRSVVDGMRCGSVYLSECGYNTAVLGLPACP